VLHPALYCMLFTNWAYDASNNYTTTLLKAQLGPFSSSTLNNSMYFHLVYVTLFHLQPLAHGIMQCIFICVVVSSWATFPMNKQVKILMVQACSCRVAAATLPIQISWWSLWCVHLCVA